VLPTAASTQMAPSLMLKLWMKGKPRNSCFAGMTNFSNQQGVSLQVRGLRKSYEGHEVLKGVNFEVSPGEILVIMGPSGSGKTVLLRHLVGLEVPDGGTIIQSSMLV
jgi:ABC-type glutathione transport system ATPase component